jgi:hydrogenase maturation protease
VRGRAASVTRVRVIACGNPEAADDAAGLITVRRVRADLDRLPSVEVVEAGPGLRLLDLLEGVDAVIVVDSVRTPGGDRHPGEIVRAEAGPQGLTAIVTGSISSHGFGVGEVLGLAGALGPVPDLVFLGVEVEDVTAGHPLSEPVEKALPTLSRMLTAEVGRLAGKAT